MILKSKRVCLGFFLTFEFNVKESGYIKHIDAEKIGKAAMMLGAGRATKDDIIDHSVGLIMHKKVGDQFVSGESILTLYHQNNMRDEILETLNSAFVFSKEKVEKIPTVLGMIG